MQQKERSCFCIHSVSLCLFIGELSLLILNDINDQWLLTPVIILVGEFVCFPSLSCAVGGLSDVCAIVGVVGFLGLRFSF